MKMEMVYPFGRYRTFLSLTLILLLLSGWGEQRARSETKKARQEAGGIVLDKTGLPPRTVLERVPERPVPEWLRTHWRVGHLPPAGWRMVDEFTKAGYNV